MCVCNLDYYKNAIKKIKQESNPEIYCIFSDDIQWCKENLGSFLEENITIYVNWNKGKNSYRDMQLMSLCNYNIIANSSFSWWGAWLNNHNDKIVISPKTWMNKSIINDPICDDWIRI